jgi:hypothetical protein
MKYKVYPYHKLIEANDLLIRCYSEINYMLDGTMSIEGVRPLQQEIKDYLMDNDLIESEDEEEQ